jgi:hypothetical protein
MTSRELFIAEEVCREEGVSRLIMDRGERDD